MSVRGVLGRKRKVRMFVFDSVPLSQERSHVKPGKGSSCDEAGEKAVEICKKKQIFSPVFAVSCKYGGFLLPCQAFHAFGWKASS